MKHDMPFDIHRIQDENTYWTVIWRRGLGWWWIQEYGVQETRPLPSNWHFVDLD